MTFKPTIGVGHDLIGILCQCLNLDFVQQKEKGLDKGPSTNSALLTELKCGYKWRANQLSEQREETIPSSLKEGGGA